MTKFVGAICKKKSKVFKSVHANIGFAHGANLLQKTTNALGEPKMLSYLEIVTVGWLPTGGVRLAYI